MRNKVGIVIIIIIKRRRLVLLYKMMTCMMELMIEVMVWKNELTDLWG